MVYGNKKRDNGNEVSEALEGAKQTNFQKCSLDASGTTNDLWDRITKIIVHIQTDKKEHVERQWDLIGEDGLAYNKSNVLNSR